MKQNEVLVTREDLTKAYQTACAVTDDDTQPDELRAAAADVQFRLSEVLLYQNHGADGERSIRLVPVGFGWPQHYTAMVDEYLIDLGEEVREAMPVHVLMAKQAAALVDNALYSADFRLDAYDALNVILAGFKRAVEDDEAGEGE
jgi:hypothetical protein